MTPYAKQVLEHRLGDLRGARLRAADVLKSLEDQVAAARSELRETDAAIEALCADLGRPV